MKTRLFLTLLLTALCFSGRAQTSQMEYRPFAQDGKMWHCQLGPIKENAYDNLIEGDTLIGGEIWKKVYSVPDLRINYYAAVRDVDGKVYAIARGSDRSRLLYDFSLKEGDIVRCGMEGNSFGCLLEKDEKPDTLLGFEFKAYLKVNRIDTITDYDHQQIHRVFILTLLDAYKYPLMDIEEENSIYNNVIWIEGIGSYTGPFSPWTPLPAHNFTLRSCSVDKTYIYGYPYDYEPYYYKWGEDEDDETAVSRNQHVTDSSGAIFNLFGFRMTRPSDRGIYIQNGKKFVAK